MSAEIVRASAGAGKTYALSSRYIGALRQGAGCRPDGILASTFTRKAAGEILQRVLERLAEACQSDAARAQLANEAGFDPGDPAAPLTYLRTFCRALNRASVCTLDSYFFRLLSVVRYEIGLSMLPQPEDENGLVMQLIGREAIRRTLAENQSEHFMGLLDQLMGDKATRDVAKELADVVRDAYNVYREAPPEAWEQLGVPVAPETQDVERALSQASSLAATLDGQLGKALRQAADMAATRDWEGFLTKGPQKALAHGECQYSRKDIPAAVAAALGTLIAQAESTLLGRLDRQTRATRAFLEEYDRQYQLGCARSGRLSFSDVIYRLRDHVAKMSAADLFHRLDARIEHLLLDEFQDTSLSQWEILKPIAVNVGAEAITGRSLFCVGDLKQAIYGWRGGSAAILENLESVLPGARILNLDVTYRCSRGIVDTVNRVFGRLQDLLPGLVAPADEQREEAERAAQEWHAAYQPLHSRADAPGGYVELLEASTTDAGSSAPPADDGPMNGESNTPSQARLRFVTRCVATLARTGGTVGVLVRRNAFARKVIFDLRREGIRAGSEAGSPVSDDPAVGMILSAIQLADHPGDTAAAFHLCNTPLGAALGITNTDRSSRRAAASGIRRMLVSKGYSAVISRWADALGPQCNRQTQHRLRQLIGLADQFDAVSQPRAQDFVAHVESTDAPDAEPGLVRVMTIHSAKGLEFDSVVLPELDGQLNRLGAPLLVERATRTGPIVAVSRCPKASILAIAPEKVRAAYTAARVEAIREALCVLYVAMTRAKHSLHLIASPSRYKMTAVNLVTAALAPDGEPQDLEQGGKRLWSSGAPPEAPTVEADRAVVQEVQPEADARVARQVDESHTEALVRDAAPTAGATRTEPLGATVRRYRRIAPSALERGGKVSARRLLNPEPTDSMVRGILMHAWINHVEWLDDGEPGDDELRALARDTCPGRPAGWLDEQIGPFRDMLRATAVRAALSRPDDGARDGLSLWRERPFAVTARERLLIGAFDRVVLAGTAGNWKQARIMDFKTDAVNSEKELTAAVEAYRPQMHAYREALCAMLALEPEAVVITLVFLAPGRVTDV